MQDLPCFACVWMETVLQKHQNRMMKTTISQQYTSFVFFFAETRSVDVTSVDRENAWWSKLLWAIDSKFEAQRLGKTSCVTSYCVVVRVSGNRSAAIPHSRPTAAGIIHRMEFQPVNHCHNPTENLPEQPLASEMLGGVIQLTVLHVKLVEWHKRN